MKVKESKAQVLLPGQSKQNKKRKVKRNEMKRKRKRKATNALNEAEKEEKRWKSVGPLELENLMEAQKTRAQAGIHSYICIYILYIYLSVFLAAAEHENEFFPPPNCFLCQSSQIKIIIKSAQ